MMKHLVKSAIMVLVLLVGLACFDASAQASNTVEASSATKVTAVYGVTADDYLPVQEVSTPHVRSTVRRGSSISALDLPDAFFFIGGPIFLLLLLHLLVTFLNGFEEKRREEQRQAASEHIGE
jgi:hypothetical protein